MMFPLVFDDRILAFAIGFLVMVTDSAMGKYIVQTQ